MTTTDPDTGPVGPAPFTSPGRVATPITFTDADMAAIQFGGDGLVPAIVQDAGDGTVLMVGYMDDTALRRTLSSGR